MPGLEVVVFWVATVLAVLGGIGVIASPKPVYSAVSLILTLANLAILYLLLNAQFIAAAQVLIYAGAVMVLFLFVITLLGVRDVLSCLVTVSHCSVWARSFWEPCCLAGHLLCLQVGNGTDRAFTAITAPGRSARQRSGFRPRTVQRLSAAVRSNALPAGGGHGRRGCAGEGEST